MTDTKQVYDICCNHLEACGEYGKYFLLGLMWSLHQGVIDLKHIAKLYRAFDEQCESQAMLDQVARCLQGVSDGHKEGGIVNLAMEENFSANNDN